jgi:DNA-binding NarL/FixJ family response regulator
MAGLDRPVFRGSRHDDASWPAHLEGALAEAEGRLEAALASYAEATTHPGRRRSPAFEAGARLGAARVLLALDRPDEAREHASAAAALLERWPGWRQDEAGALLHRLGQGRGQPSGRADLTARELEVAVLVARGLSNGEIGSRLFISTKTASVHVSNILRKLGMASRAEVAAWAAMEGLLED